MWGAIRKDLGEFVSTVTTDATDALSQLDNNLDGGEDGRPRREAASLIDPDTGMPIEYDNNDDYDDEDEDDDEDDDDKEAAANELMTSLLPPPPEKATVEEMKSFLLSNDNVFLDDIDVDNLEEADKEFLMNEFNVETKTDEITKLLKENPNTLQQTFSRNNDQINYESFWKHYFYRIDRRLEDTYTEYYEKALLKEVQLKQQQQQQHRNAKAAKAALSNVTNFLGGVVHRLVEENDVNDMADDDEEIVDNDDNEDDNNNGNNNADSRGGVGRGFSHFLSNTVANASGRPPFVLNTAVSDDDNDDGDEEDDDDNDDDDEELGWDDDEEEEEEEGEDNDYDDKNETVEFKDAEKEKLQEELALAQEERDMLHKTVELQTEEIKRLQQQMSNSKSSTGNVDDDSNQINNLQMQLFEKDSELAALRAQLDDLKHDDDEDEKYETEASKAAAVEAAREIDRLKEIIANKDKEILELQQAEKVDEQYESESSATAAAATREVERLKELMTEKDNEIQRLETSLMESTHQFQSKLDGIKTEKDEMKASYETKLEELQQKDDGFGNDDDSLQIMFSKKVDEIESLKDELSKLQSTMNEQLELAKTKMLNAKEEMEKAEQDASAAKSELFTTQTRLQELQTSLDLSKETIADLQMELVQTNALLKDRDAEILHLKRPSSPGSNSTGVKIQSMEASSVDDILPESTTTTTTTIGGAAAPSLPAVTTASIPIATTTTTTDNNNYNNNNNNEDDGWGDDW